MSIALLNTCLTLVIAQAPPTAVLSLDGDQALSPDIQSRIEAKLGLRGYQPLDPADTAALQSVRARGEQTTAAALFIEAKVAHQQFDESGAEARLAEARAALCESSRVLAERSLLADIHLLLGQIALTDNRHEAASQHLALAARLEPGRQLHPGLHAPELLSAYAEALEGYRAIPPGALVIDSQPTGAEIYLDGEAVGPAPRVVDNVAAGPHYITAALSDRGARSRIAEVQSGHSQNVSIFVPGSEARVGLTEILIRYRDAPDDATAARALLDAVGADALVAMGQTRSTAALRTAGDNVLVTQVDATNSTVDVTADQLLDLLEAMRRAEDQARGSEPPRQPRDAQADLEPETNLTWLWVTLGASTAGLLIAGAVVGGYLWVNRQQPAPPDLVNIILGGPGL